MLCEPRGESDYPVVAEEGAGSPQRNGSWAEGTLKDKKKFTKVPWLEEHASIHPTTTEHPRVLVTLLATGIQQGTGHKGSVLKELTMQ